MKKIFENNLFNNLIECGVDNMDITTYYDILNKANNGESISNLTDNLEVLKHDLLKIFENRVEFLLVESLNRLLFNLTRLNNQLTKHESVSIQFLELMNKDVIIKKIRKQMPYLFDFMFYYDIDLADTSTMVITTMEIRRIVHERISISVSFSNEQEGIPASEVYLILDNVNNLFLLSVSNNILELMYEANSIFKIIN